MWYKAGTELSSLILLSLTFTSDPARNTRQMFLLLALFVAAPTLPFLPSVLLLRRKHDRTKANIIPHLDNESPVTNPFYPLWFRFSTWPSSHVIQEKSDYITSLIKTFNGFHYVFKNKTPSHGLESFALCAPVHVSATPHPASLFLSASSSLACSQPLICTATGLSLMLPPQPRASCLCLFLPS